ncbi:RNA-binding protein Nova-1 isoform X3 [Chrysoperla carnea]|uniref:RNA-binding protein Nova-1 isoform X3 n=1 Tax=Chrysoperla carnea TaxID=189513 RepID=UPI001D07ACF5|nr:RNA-binding protein Nova-1 isoform X3 [Chrysoperla carnea]
MAADSGMDTCPSPENADSRKRPLDCGDENGETKRSHFSPGTSGDGIFHFKLLVPSVAAGAIIGKGGETIAQLQKDTGARVKMSKSHDFYPGTTERVCLITGTVEAIMSVLDFIMDKIREKPEVNKPLGDYDTKTTEREKQVKILVPNSTAGMVIGKAGNYIKQIKEDTGSYVQISQKAKEVSLQERCITIIGEKDSNKRACLLILAKIVDDPQSGTCLNVSYADMPGPVANFNPTGSPYAGGTTAAGSTFGSNSTLSGVTSASGLMLNGAATGGLNLNLNLNAPIQNVNPALTAQLLEHVKVSLRNGGYSDAAIAEIIAAMGVLSKYGILGMGLGLGAGTALAMQQMPAAAYLGVAMEQAAAANSTGVFGPIGQVSLVAQMNHSLAAATGTTSPTSRTNLDRYADSAAFDPFRGSSAATAPISLNNNSFGLGTSATGQIATAAAAVQQMSKSPTPAAEITGGTGPKDTKNVEIPEIIVGAILGPGGRSLIEIQHLSGASIQISKKGIFAPGTRNRIVTITGTPGQINTAQYLIEQRITEEEGKRARQTTAIGNLMQ